MTLEICNKMDHIENCDIQNLNFSTYPVKMETNDTKDFVNIDKDLFYNMSGKSLDSSQEPDLEMLRNIPMMDAQSPDFMPADVQHCIEIESSVINIPENQIVEIQFTKENGEVDTTKYIVNDDILQVHLNNQNNFLELNQENIYEDQIVYNPNVIYEETVTNTEETSVNNTDSNSLMDENLILTSLNNENIQPSEMHSTMLSPQSENEETTETDLTSLNWLHNITNIMSVPNLPTPPVSPKPKKKQNNSNQEDLTININSYKKNGDKKPPFSYATLICMAMGKNGNKMTLSAIYHWIRENFLYYRKAHPSWQVSPYMSMFNRHNKNILIIPEFNQTQPLAEQMFRKGGTFERRARKRRFLETGFGTAGGISTRQKTIESHGTGTEEPSPSQSSETATETEKVSPVSKHWRA